MRETRYDTDSKKTPDSFFDDYPPEYSPLQNFTGGSKLSSPEESDDFTVSRNRLVGFLKQAFLFFPGAFLLFFTSLGTTLFIKAILANPSPRMFLPHFVGIAAFLMTWIGLGDINNKKHLAIPGSIIFSGFVTGMIVHLLREFFPLADRIFYDFDYAVLLFPIGLIAPVLAKGWVDSISDS